MGIIRLLHARHIAFTDCHMFHNRVWVVLADDNSTTLLHSQRRLPWLVNKLGRETFKLREPLANVVSIGISLFAKGDWTIAPEVLVKVSSAAKPLPIKVVDRPVGVDQQVFKHSRSLLPVLKQVSPC